jgi:DNA helicase II / ATP-dependent DNA helicase PcrA
MATDEFRVYGPPGTGKTTYVAREATRAAEKFGADQVSICSLTNAAVFEAASRDLPLPGGNVTTLHARCKRALQAPAPAETRVREFVDANPRYVDAFPANLLRRDSDDLMNRRAKGLTLYETVCLLRQQLVPKTGWHPKAARFFGVWDGWCREAGTMDFTHWLEEALSRRAALPAQQVVFVDEAQDHTPLQLAVVRHWPARWLVLVGDDDQSIYEWSGADPKHFFDPPLPDDRELVLSQSYRVPGRVHELAATWIRGVRDRRVKEYHPRDERGYARAGRYSLNTAEEGVLPDGLGEGGSHMILTTCRYMLNPIRKELIERGIPFHNPYTESSWMNPLAGAAEAINAFLYGTWTLAEARLWAEPLASRGAAFQDGQRQKFLDRCELDPNARLDLDLLRASFTEDALRLILARDLGIFERPYRRMSTSGNWQYALRVYRREGRRAEWGDPRDPRIILGTVHSVKGGQADHVWLFPDLSYAGYSDLSSRGGSDRLRRLFYVAVTRARVGLTLCAPSGMYSVEDLHHLVDR